MRHLHFIVNPNAGRGRASTVWRDLSSRIGGYAESQGIQIESSNSISLNNGSTEGSIQELNNLASNTILVAVGGDGTVHSAARQALQLGLPLAVVPCGTGNDYACTMQLPRDLTALMEMLLTGTPTAVDTIRINNNYAFNVAGYGLDAEIVQRIEQYPQLKRLGRLGYGIILPTALRKHNPFSVRINQPDSGQTTFSNVHLVAIANGTRFGGGMKIAPGASVTDGKADVIIVSSLTKMRLLRLFPKIYTGTHTSLSQVHQFTSKGFQLEFTATAPVAEYDGELYPAAKILNIDVVPGLRMILPNAQ